MTDTIYLVHSGDHSSHVWDYWYYYWKKYYTCKEIDTVFLCEDIDKKYPGVMFRHTGNVPWADGLIDFLNAIPSSYIIYQHEDYFLTEKTNAELLYKLIAICKKNNFNLLKCCGWWAGFMSDEAPFKEAFEFGENIWRYNNDSPYLISHQTSIWEKNFLVTTLRRGETPWQHELAGTARLKNRCLPLYAYRAKGPLEYAETMVHGTIREGSNKLFEIDLTEGTDGN